jgi:S-layer homology domain
MHGGGGSLPLLPTQRPPTRAQLTKFIYRAHHLAPYTPTGGQSFTDVPPSYFAYGYIETVNHDAIVGGYTAPQCAAAGAAYPCFLPNQNVHRDEVAKMVKKMLDSTAATATPAPATNTPTNTFTPTRTNTPAPPTSTPARPTSTATLTTLKP